MEPQPAMPQNTTFFQEYQSIDNSANLRGQFYRFRIHDLFLASKNRNVKIVLLDKRSHAEPTETIAGAGSSSA